MQNKDREIEGKGHFSQNLTTEWLKHHAYLMQTFPEAEDVKINAFGEHLASEEFNKNEKKIKEHGFSANELIRYYECDFIPSAGQREALEKRVKKYTKNGELGYYIWNQKGILRTRILIERIEKYARRKFRL